MSTNHRKFYIVFTLMAAGSYRTEITVPTSDDSPDSL